MSRSTGQGTVDLLSDNQIDDLVERGLSARTITLIEGSASDSTKDNRDRYWKLFAEDFCANSGGTGLDGTRLRGLKSLPCTPTTLAEFVGWMAHRGFAPSTIGIALATVRWKHRTAGETVPDGVMAASALRGYQHELINGGWRPRRSAPARTSELERLIEPCDLDTAQGLRDRSMMLLGYAAAARRIALVNLDVIDFRPKDKRNHVLHIYKDKRGAQRTVPIPHWGTPRKGRCRDPLCPACATLAWTELLKDKRVERGPLYRPVDRYDNIAGVTAIGGNHDPKLSVTAINVIMNRLRLEAGLPAGITPHGLRAGFATETYENGGDPLAIRRHGGWADSSAAFNVYIRDVDATVMNPVLHVAASRERRRAPRG